MGKDILPGCDNGEEGVVNSFAGEELASLGFGEIVILPNNNVETGYHCLVASEVLQFNNKNPLTGEIIPKDFIKKCEYITKILLNYYEKDKEELSAPINKREYLETVIQNINSYVSIYGPTLGRRSVEDRRDLINSIVSLWGEQINFFEFCVNIDYNNNDAFLDVLYLVALNIEVSHQIITDWFADWDYQENAKG